MKTTLLKPALAALLLVLSVALSPTFCKTGSSSTSKPSQVVPSAGPAESIDPVTDVNLFSSAAAQVRPNLAPFCTIPSHAVTLNVSRVRSYVLRFREPHDETTPFTQFLRPSLVPDCRFIRHHLVLVPATRNQPGSVDIDYLPLLFGKQALMISETGGQPGTTVFTFSVPASSVPLDAAHAQAELAAILSRYFLWSPKVADQIAIQRGANFECSLTSASLPGNVFDTLDAEVTPAFVVIKMRNARPQDYKLGQKVVMPTNWFWFLEASDQGDHHPQKEKEWQECAGSDPGKTK